MIKIDDVIPVKVERINPTYILGNYDNYKCFCHISEMSDMFIKDLNEFVEIGKKYLFKVILIDHNKKELKMSFKAIRPELIRKMHPIQTYSGFKNLSEKIEEFLKYE